MLGFVILWLLRTGLRVQQGHKAPQEPQALAAGAAGPAEPQCSGTMQVTAAVPDPATSPFSTDS